MSKETKKQKTFTNSLKGSRLWGIVIFIALVFVDQVTKMIAEIYSGTPGAYDRYDILQWLKEGILVFDFSHNNGVAFGALANASPLVKVLIVIATAVLMAVLAFMYFKMDKNRTLFRLAIVFIVAGGVGNLIDRLACQVWLPGATGVRDFLEVNILFNFGVCNFADFFIVAGVIMMILAMLFYDSNALYPQGKYEKLAMIEAQKENKRKSEKFRKKYEKYAQGK